MIRKIIYVAEDGTEFESEGACILYEEKRKEESFMQIQNCMCELSKKIYKFYYSNEKLEECVCALGYAHICLKNTIVYILSDKQIDVISTEMEILEMIDATGYKSEILRRYICMDEIKQEVLIRRDYLSAFQNIKSGKEISSIIGYSFGKRDLKQLAELHKENKCQKKIEDLLEDCNFHYECEKFIHHEYDEFLK